MVASAGKGRGGPGTIRPRYASNEPNSATTRKNAAAPLATWKTAAYTGDELSAIFANDVRTNVGALTGLDLSSRGVSGRLIRVTLVGALGSKTVSGDVFRAVFNAWRPPIDPLMRSSLVDTQPIP